MKIGCIDLQRIRFYIDSPAVNISTTEFTPTFTAVFSTNHGGDAYTHLYSGEAQIILQVVQLHQERRRRVYH